MIVMEDKKIKRYFQTAVRQALKEDIGRGDITTNSIISDQDRVLGIIFPKQNGVLCGLELAQMVFAELDPRINFEAQMRDGDQFTTGSAIATLIGPAAGCLKGERTALNFLQHLSGIATLTRRYVEAAGSRIKILDTRKTTPGLRALEKYAVRTGGGYNHRAGLYDMILIKDNHIQIAGSITRAVEAVRNKSRRAFIEVEVRTPEELRETIALKVQRIMLDNMNLDQLRRAVDLIRNNEPLRRRTEIEVSGGVTLESIDGLRDLDIDYISIGTLTHSAPAVDIALKMKPISSGA